MNNTELIEALEELFNLTAAVDTEFSTSFYTDDFGNNQIMIESGEAELQELLTLLNDITPYLFIVQQLLLEAEDGDQIFFDDAEDFEDIEEE
jgi:hypothetical protein